MGIWSWSSCVCMGGLAYQKTRPTGDLLHGWRPFQKGSGLPLERGNHLEALPDLDECEIYEGLGIF